MTAGVDRGVEEAGVRGHTRVGDLKEELHILHINPMLNVKFVCSQ